MASRDWWRDAVTYQLYIRSFADADGDGLGDIAGIRSRLPYLAQLGVDAIWVNPWYPSPQADAGYDVADYRNIHPPFGTLAEAQQLIDEAHALGLKVLLDVVPNHTSVQHPWFAAALAAGPGSPERDRYWFRPGRGEGGNEPPNNWTSVFGGPAWTRTAAAPGEDEPQWYLHLFDSSQPDLNWSQPEVVAEFEDILRFWFDRGADGFRIDVAHGLAKKPGLPDLQVDAAAQTILGHQHQEDHPYWDRPEVQKIWEGWRAVADEYDPPRAFVAEAWVASPDRLVHYLQPTRLHSAFDFEFLRAPWHATDLREFARRSLAANEAANAPVIWVLSNHDVTRHVTRLGRDQDQPGDPLHDQRPTDLALGTRRAGAAILLVLALPGGVYLYQGEELGLEEVLDLPDHLRQDPTWHRSGHTVLGRDGCRVPLPWTRTGPSFGFGDVAGWLPQPAHWSELSVQAQQEDPRSMLSLYRTALHLRRSLPQLGASAAELRWLDEDSEVLTFARGTDFQCVVNTSAAPVPLPAGEVVLSSQDCVDRLLPPDAAAWLTGC